MGFNGEPLGCEPRPGCGEGKTVPAHLRKSHRKFVEQVECHDCEIEIHERCEHCSVRMHCMGCRKTLCANCAFSLPLPRPKAREREAFDHVGGGAEEEEEELFWWAPGQTRNPNLMMQESTPDNNNNPNVPNSSVTPTMKMHWCCLRPRFSNGSAATFLHDPGATESATSQMRTSPLPGGEGYEDAAFSRTDIEAKSSSSVIGRDRSNLQTLQWFLYGPGSQDQNPSPRILCHQCWQSSDWKATCLACKESLCFAHDFQRSIVRVCGYQDLATEKALLKRELCEFKILILTWDKIKQTETSELEAKFFAEIRNSGITLDCLGKLRDILCWMRRPKSIGTELWKEIQYLALSFRAGRILPTPVSSVAGTPLIPSDGEKRTTEGQAPKSIGPDILWRGCGSFMCPEYRHPDDHRPKCTAAAKQCTYCKVFACPECLALRPPCDCSYCKTCYACPSCAHRLASGCKKAEEEEEKRRREEELEVMEAAAMLMQPRGFSEMDFFVVGGDEPK